LGHRKHNAPRRGSLAFAPRARHQLLVPRVRTWTRLGGSGPSLAGVPAIKVGMVHAITADDREKTPNFGKPTFNAATVVALPEIHVYGIRAYATADGREMALLDLFAEDLDAETRSRLGRTRTAAGGKSAAQSRRQEDENRFQNVLANVDRLSLLVGIIPRESGLSIDRPQVQEVGIVGGDTRSQFEYAKRVLGKTIKSAELLKPGAFVDTIAVTKGKGFEGPITRFGVKRKQHKSRKSVRAVGVISPWHPATVMYTVPRAGQMGFHQRVCLNNRILFVGKGSQTRITPRGGFLHFGEVRGDFAVLRGSVPGASQRVVDLRFPLNPRRQKVREPRVIEMNVGGRPIQQLISSLGAEGKKS
jgi:large subunit ribosomal protein L3